MDFDFSTETITPDTTNLLTIGGTGGFELPIGTTLQRPVTGLANGALRYNTDLSVIEGYVNSTWTAMATGTTTLTLTGDVTGSGAGSIATTLATVNSNVGTFAVQTVNGKGLVTAAQNMSGDVTTSGAVSTLATVNANVGTFASVTVNGKGLVTAATALAGDATTSGATITLATVNGGPVSNSFQKITTNGKGLVTASTAVTSTDITTALGFTPVNKAGDTMTGLLVLSGDPTAPLGAATKQYVDNAVAGLSWKQSVRAATTTNGTLATAYANGSTIDGVTLATGDRILIKNQTTQTENGIYIVAASGAPTRSTDADSGAELVGATVYVDQGTVNADTGWTQTTNAPITIGTSNIVFAQFSGSGSYSAGTGLTLTGNTFSLTTPVVPSLGGTGTVSAPTSGQVLIGTSGNVYAPATIGTTTGISLTSGSGTLTINNTGVTSNVAGTGISVSGATGAVTISNTGVLSITGTANQIAASSSTGAITLSLPSTLIAPGTLTVTSLTANSFVYSGTSNVLTSTGAPTNGQLLIGSTGAAPTLGTITGSTGLSVTNGAGTIALANTGVTSIIAGTGINVSGGTGAVTVSAVNLGTVTSVALALPVSVFTVTGSPVTSTGTLTGSFTSQTANTAFLAPNGSAGTPSFRLLAYADLPLKLYAENPSSPLALTVAGTNAIATGSGTSATATSSQASGLQSIARVYGERAYSSGQFATLGDAQHGEYNLRAITSNNTATEVFLDGASARLVLPNNSAYMFAADIVCRRTDATGTVGAWTISGLIFRDASAATTAIQTAISKTTIAKSTGALDVTAVADTTNGSLKITVTGLTGQTIRWSVYVRTQEVTN